VNAKNRNESKITGGAKMGVASTLKGSWLAHCRLGFCLATLAPSKLDKQQGNANT